MKKWMLLLLAGLGVALAGFYFAGGLFVGLLGSGDAGVELTVGLLLFLCFLVTVCTRPYTVKIRRIEKAAGPEEILWGTLLTGAKSWPGRNERRFHSNTQSPCRVPRNRGRGFFGAWDPGGVIYADQSSPSNPMGNTHRPPRRALCSDGRSRFGKGEGEPRSRRSGGGPQRSRSLRKAGDFPGRCT